ncbi:uncharacterized protein TM35_000042270 [Trypanosoma theileri]|uniref:Uncharacterized protein n=1 Tax=Trypanosoma theileri TaxID=67003 RepID=A0A1X0P5U5_9TRYP|nr:uncharacterized protein TM35_000042270 [Trypanosoma theileri]ORC92013.1 hypothetical protein TM35_000042270 [Trypanosoma theileri]
MENQCAAVSVNEKSDGRSTQLTRNSFMPSWMADPSWLQSIEIPQDYMAELLEENMNGSSGATNKFLNPSKLRPSKTTAATTTTSTTSSLLPVEGKRGNKPNAVLSLLETARRTMTLWVEDDGEKKDMESQHQQLMSLLSDCIKSVTQRAPWDPEEYTTEMRKNMLEILLKKFLDQSLDPAAVSLFAKDVIRRSSETNVVQELQCLCVVLTYDKTWNGEDPYRQVENFISSKEFEEFKEESLEEVKRRLHMMNIDLSKRDINATRALTIWKDIHGEHRGNCFGNSITLTLTSVRLGVIDKDQASNDKGGKKGLPKKVKATWFLRDKDRVVSSAKVLGKNTLNDNEYQWKGGGNRATLLIPKGANKQFKEYTIVLELTVRNESCVCTGPREKLLACVSISVDDALYVSVAQLDSPLRQRRSEPSSEPFVSEPFGNEDTKIIGYHFSSLLLSSNSKSSNTENNNDIYPYVVESAKALCSMPCLNQDHNKRPPVIDVEKEMAAEEAHSNLFTSNVNLDSLCTNHHKSFLRLVDILGDLDDTCVSILKAYTRRYLVHEELENIALLVSVCTRSNLVDRTSRELCSHALESIADLNGHVRTRIGGRLLKEAFDTTHSHIFDIILSLEDVPSSSSSDSLQKQAAVILNDLKQLLLIMYPEMDFNVILKLEAQKDVLPMVEMLLKLDGRLLREHRRTQVRETKTDLHILQLDQQQDSVLLTGKTRFLLEFMKQLCERCQRALSLTKGPRSAEVIVVMLCRLECISHDVSDPLRSVVSRLVGCLARTPDVDPLGDALGLVVEVCGALATLGGLLRGDKRAAEVCGDLLSCCDWCCSQMPLWWFALCEPHVGAWVAAVVAVDHERENDEEDRDGDKGEASLSCGLGLLLDLQRALLAVAVRILAWLPPEKNYDGTPALDTHGIYAGRFFALQRAVVEAAVDAIVARGRTGRGLHAALETRATLRQHDAAARAFTDADVHDALVRNNDPHNLLEHERRVSAQLTHATIIAAADDFSQHIRNDMERTALSQLADVAAPEANIKQAATRLATHIKGELQLAKRILDKDDFAEFFSEVAVRAYFNAFQRLLDQYSASPMPPERVPLLLQLLHTLEEELQSVVDIAKMETESVISMKLKTNVMSVLLSESSAALVEMANSSVLNEVEREQVTRILRFRTDNIAKQYIRKVGAK